MWPRAALLLLLTGLFAVPSAAAEALPPCAPPYGCDEVPAWAYEHCMTHPPYFGRPAPGAPVVCPIVDENATAALLAGETAFADAEALAEDCATAACERTVEECRTGDDPIADMCRWSGGAAWFAEEIPRTVDAWKGRARGYAEGCVEDPSCPEVRADADAIRSDVVTVAVAVRDHAILRVEDCERNMTCRLAREDASAIALLAVERADENATFFGDYGEAAWIEARRFFMDSVPASLGPRLCSTPYATPCALSDVPSAIGSDVYGAADPAVAPVFPAPGGALDVARTPAASLGGALPLPCPPRGDPSSPWCA